MKVGSFLILSYVITLKAHGFLYLLFRLFPGSLLLCYCSSLLAVFSSCIINAALHWLSFSLLIQHASTYLWRILLLHLAYCGRLLIGFLFCFLIWHSAVEPQLICGKIFASFVCGCCFLMNDEGGFEGIMFGRFVKMNESVLTMMIWGRWRNEEAVAV